MTQSKKADQNRTRRAEEGVSTSSRSDAAESDEISSSAASKSARAVQVQFPQINLFWTSLGVFMAYIIITAITGVILTLTSGGLHPATRVFFFAVVAGVAGYRILLHHSRYPEHKQLWMMLALSNIYMLLLSFAIMLKQDAIPTHVFAMYAILQTVLLMCAGYFGLVIAEHAFKRFAR